MPPKRRGAQAKAANPAAKAATNDQPKPTPSSKSAPTPVPPPPPPAPVLPPPPPPPPPPQPVETGTAKVRREWTKFMDTWYEPQKKKLVEKLQKDLLVKYKNLGSAKETQKLREMELFEKLDSIAQQLAQPARTEWERRLELAQLREDQWDDMTGEEQQEVMSVFVGFVDDLDDFEDGDVSAEPSSTEEEGNIVEELQHRGASSHTSAFPSTPSPPSRHHIPPTPNRVNFEFVNPSSFFADTMTPPNPSKNLPALSMDHLATLGPSNAGRTSEPTSASFHHWASEAVIMTQQPQNQPSVSHPASTSAQTLSARPRATDNMSRQVSAASNLSSPPLKTSSLQYSPPNVTTKFSPSTNVENLPLGKRYIGPVITEEELDPLDEELLRSKMAEEYQQYKISLRIQMIYQFHAEAAQFEIRLFETLLAGEGTKESRARAVHDHEASMMRLREQKEEERKRLCAEEREKRREEIRQHFAQRRTVQSREVDPPPKANPPPKPCPDKWSVQQRPVKMTDQKENVPLPQPIAVAPSTRLEPPSVIKKSISTLSQDEASANEVVFANAMAMMQGKAGTTGLTPAQASMNEAMFTSAATMLAAQNQPMQNNRNTLQLPQPSIIRKSTSSHSQEYDIPQITVSFAETPGLAPEPAKVPPPTVKGKKSGKGQPAMQPSPAKPIVITEEPEMDMDAEPPPPSLWDTAAVATKNMWGAASASLSAPKVNVNAPVEEEREPGVTSKAAPVKANAQGKKMASAGKKGKRVTITEEPDVDADPIVSPLPSAKPKTAKGGWGAVNGKSKATPPIAEERGQEPEPCPPPPPMAPVRGTKKPAQAEAAATRPKLKVTTSEEQESEMAPGVVPSRTNKANTKSAWGVPATVPANTAPGKKGTQQQVDPRRGPPSSGLTKFARVEMVPDPEDEDELLEMVAGGNGLMPGALGMAGLGEAEAEAENDEDESDASAWFNPENISYWSNFMAGQPEAETPAPPRSVEPTSSSSDKHALWTPTVCQESEDEDDPGEADEELATSMWMQYAISGGDIPALGNAPEEPHVTFESAGARHDSSMSIWEQGKGKKKLTTTTVDAGNRAQQTSVFDRAAFTGQWPKMESWLSPPARGQSSGSTRVF